MKIRVDWKKSYKLISVQLLIVAAIVEAIGEHLGELTPRWMNLLLIVVTFAGRLMENSGRESVEPEE
jgi:hypothetical protein